MFLLFFCCFLIHHTPSPSLPPAAVAQHWALYAVCERGEWRALTQSGRGISGSRVQQTPNVDEMRRKAKQWSFHAGRTRSRPLIPLVSVWSGSWFLTPAFPLSSPITENLPSPLRDLALQPFARAYFSTHTPVRLVNDGKKRILISIKQRLWHCVYSLPQKDLVSASFFPRLKPMLCCTQRSERSTKRCCEDKRLLLFVKKTGKLLHGPTSYLEQYCNTFYACVYTFLPLSVFLLDFYSLGSRGPGCR